MPTPETRDALLSLLDWYVESGVDLALDEGPHDRYADCARAAAAPGVEAAPSGAHHESPVPVVADAPPARLRPAPAVAAPDDAARAAEEAAAGAKTLRELALALAEFPHAPFREMAQHFLFSAGSPGSRLMAIDAAPGATEESTGEAFSGRQAALLDNMLAAIKATRETAYLAYVSPWRPPGVLSITPQQAAIFAPFARRHVELARPEVLLLFGEAPARVLIGGSEPFSKQRGKRFDLRCGEHSAQAFVFSGLDAMLKSWALKPAAWRLLREAAGALRS
jgi:uracil-DNA glycosylase family 4